MIRVPQLRLIRLSKALNYTKWQLLKQQAVKSKLQIVEKKKINHDSYIYYLKWAGPQFIIPIGQHFRIVQNIPTWEHPEGEEVAKKYTPISPCSQKDLIELLLKVYRPGQHADFPNGGKLTPYLQTLKVGDVINVDGPYGKFGYKAGGIVTINGKQMKKKRIFFIAGGSGITPCYQTICEIMKMPNETIELILLYANKKSSDILLKQQLQNLTPRLKLYFTLDVAPEKWNFFSGYATQKMLETICSLDDPDTLYIHCGPRGMNLFIRQLFNKQYPNSTIFKY